MHYIELLTEYKLSLLKEKNLAIMVKPTGNSASLNRGRSRYRYVELLQAQIVTDRLARTIADIEVARHHIP